MNVSNRIPVLMYHRVGRTENAWEARYGIHPDVFSAHMAALARKRYRAIPVDALVDWLEGGSSLPNGSFVLTFDDGFRGVREHAVPVLERLGWPCTVFLVSDLIGGDDEWTREENPSGTAYPLLDEEEIREMQGRNVSFHSHTRSHADLPTLNDDGLADQLVGSRRALSRLLGQDVAYIAYPFGRLDDRVEAAARAAGYRAAFSTQPGFNRWDVNRYRIRRLDVFGTDTPSMLLRKVKFGSNDGSVGQTVRYYRDRLIRRRPGGPR